MRLSLVAVLLVLCCDAAAGETAREILDRQCALQDGERRWADRQQRLHLEVVDRRRDARPMDVQLFDKKYAGRQQRTMAYFTAPDTVKGTAFLAISHPERDDEQWLYLPEHRRARRIGGALRTQGFVGTDFTYHDLELLAEMPAWRETDATSKLRGEAVIDGVACVVIELTPQRAGIGYQHIVLWLGRADLVARQVELYETAPAAGWFALTAGEPPAPTRRVRQSDVRAVGAIPVAHRTEVETPSAGTRTVVTVTHIAFDQQLPDELFTQPALEWGGYE